MDATHERAAPPASLVSGEEAAGRTAAAVLLALRFFEATAPV